MNPLNYLKAVLAAVMAGLAVAYTSLDDDILTKQEWVQIAQFSLTGFAAVYGIPNIATSGKRAKPNA